MLDDFEFKDMGGYSICINCGIDPKIESIDYLVLFSGLISEGQNKFRNGRVEIYVKLDSDMFIGSAAYTAVANLVSKLFAVNASKRINYYSKAFDKAYFESSYLQI